MLSEHHLVTSESLGRKVHVWRYGQFGAPLLVFPSASGMAHEWDAHGMVEALAELIDGGRIKLYCTESNVSEAWTRRESDPRWRIQRHLAFERFVVEELTPLIREDCRTPGIPIATSGTSLGAFYAANFALKQPAIFNYALCMSGRYDVFEFVSGLGSAETYLNNPMAYIPNLEGEALQRVRDGTHLALVCGQGKWEDGNVDETRVFADMLSAKGISHQLDIWGHDVSHEWVWWKRQALHHLRNRFGPPER
jgi:esterase/lipase superfamily enzyme